MGFKYYNKVSMIVDYNRGDNTPIALSTVQAVVATALTTSSQFPTDTSSSHPLSSTLVDSLNPNSAMDIHPVPETMSDHPLTVSPPANQGYTSGRSGLFLTLCPLMSSPSHPQLPQHSAPHQALT